MKQGWEIKKLGEVATILNGYAFDSKLFSEDSNDMPLIRIRDIKRGYTETFYKGDFSEEYIIRKGDYLVGMDGEFNIAEWKGNDALLNQRVCKIVANDIVDRYLFWYMPVVLKQIEDATPFVTVKHLSSKQLLNTIIPVPPREEQEKIVAELDCLSGVIEKKREQLKQLDALAQSIFYQMFGDPITNEKGWQVKKLDDISQIASGGTPSRKIAEYFTGDINWFSAGELNSMYLSDSIEKITQNALDETSAKLFPKGSLLVGMYDTAAFKLGILEKASSSNQACANIALYEDNVIWLYYVLMFMKDEALKHRHGARQKNLNVGFIKDFTIPIAPINLQQEFADKIEAIEKQKELIKKSISETETLFNARMDYYFN